jgi:hypothetical protein
LLRERVGAEDEPQDEEGSDVKERADRADVRCPPI